MIITTSSTRPEQMMKQCRAFGENKTKLDGDGNVVELEKHLVINKKN